MIGTPTNFPHEICTYLAAKLPARFTFGTGSGNLKLGELVAGSNGVYALEQASLPPDNQTTLEYHQIDFWSVNKNSATGYDDLKYIYNLFHGNHHFPTTNFLVQFSEVTYQITDMDRDGEGCKLWKMSIMFIVTNLIS